MTTATGRARTVAASSRDWRTSASCHGIDDETLYSERPAQQAKVQGICRGCLVRTRCLTTAVTLEEGEYMVWGIAGGLTDTQRRALRVEALLGNRPNLTQAQELATPGYAGVMAKWREWPASVVAMELREHGVLASPVTVRLAMWWTGAHAGLLSPRGADDQRSPWVVVRDECRETAQRLRELGVGNRDIAAYLGVSRDALERALKSWRRSVSAEVKAA